MPHPIDLPGNSLIALTRASLVNLRTSLFRDVGPQAAAHLQEAGFAGGEALYNAFNAWLAQRGNGATTPENIPMEMFTPLATLFFREAGWGAIEVGSVSPRVAAVDSFDWSEADPSQPLEFPGCYYTSGVFADFFGRIAGASLAVMEVECRSMGGERCRFLLGSPEVLGAIYDAMSQGVSYEDSLRG